MTVLQRQCNTHRPVGWALMPCLSTRGHLSGLWVKEIGAPLHGLLGLWVEATQFLRFPHPVCYSQPKSSLCRDPSVGARARTHTHRVKPCLAFAVGVCRHRGHRRVCMVTNIVPDARLGRIVQRSQPWLPAGIPREAFTAISAQATPSN